MVIGVPKETHHHEHRVGLNPFAVSRLIRKGHTVFVESGAGEEAHFSDKDYQNVGAQIVYSPEEAYMRADLVSRFSAVMKTELELIRPGLTICAFHHLAIRPREVVAKLLELETTLIGYEIIRDRHGERPVLIPFSEMAGQMAVQIAAYYLQHESGGRGVLMGNAPGVPPPTVLILGAGSVGQAAARQAVATGAHVIVLDEDMKQLRELNRELSGHVVTAVVSIRQLEKFTAIADVVIGAILIPGARAPFLITESMVKRMKPGSVVMDISIDQGGCVETSRPTTPENPTFMVHDVLHYCVPNMTANIPRTATRALATAAIPYLVAIADSGLERSIADNPGLAAGIFAYKGQMVHERAGKALEMPATPLSQVLRKGDRS
jgi:alanine dehydrogenase